MKKINGLLFFLSVVVLCFVLIPIPSARASWISIIYKGEDVVDGDIFHYNVLEYKKYELYRDGNNIKNWETQTEAILH